MQPSLDNFEKALKAWESRSVLIYAARDVAEWLVIVKKKPKPRIAFLREQAGLTQLELSRLVGVTESTIQNWESGRTGTDHIQRIINFCKALNCKVEDLIESESYLPEEGSKKPASLQEIHNLLGTEEEQANEAIVNEQ